MATKKTAKKKIAKNTTKKKTAKKAAKNKTKKNVAKKKSPHKTVKRKSAQRKTVKKKASLTNKDEKANSTYLLGIENADGKIEVIKSHDDLVVEFQKRFDELEQQRAHAEKVLNEVLLPDIKKGLYGQVNYFSVGFRTKRNCIVSPLKYAILLGVNHKLPGEEIVNYPFDAFPDKKTFEEKHGVEIKIIETSPDFASPNDAPVLMSSNDEYQAGWVMPKGGRTDLDQKNVHDEDHDLAETILIGGLPVSGNTEKERKNWGTFGVGFTYRKSKFGLLNAHIAPKKSYPTIQPSVIQDQEEQQFIGNTELRFFGNLEVDDFCSFVDAALIKVEFNPTSSGTIREFTESIINITKHNKFMFAGQRLESQDTLKKVRKFGAKTRKLLRGSIRNVRANITVPDINQLNSRVDAFNVIEAHGRSDGVFIEGGDSGAPLVATAIKRGKSYPLVVGICFASDSNTRAYACHMSDVIDALKLKISSKRILKNWDRLR